MNLRNKWKKMYDKGWYGEQEEELMTIQDIINEVFESEEMKDYLCEHVEELYKYQIKEMIAASPLISVQRKLEIFEWLAEGEDLKNELSEAKDEKERKHILWCSYGEIAKNTREALDTIYDTSLPAVFLLKCITYFDYDSDEYDTEETIPFSSYEKAAMYMEEQENIHGYDNRRWFQIEKWELDENGKYHETWSYIVMKGQIIYCSKPKLHRNVCLPDKDLNLPVPFKAGDIIEVQDMPFAAKQHALILDVGDNIDCCCVWQVYIDKEGRICTNALKHGDIFESWYATSPLYSANTYYGNLKEEEKVLYVFRDYIEKRIGTISMDELFKMFDYIIENEICKEDITEKVLNEIHENIE